MKITIEKLGKIDKASFEIKDLTIFVGKNSTNKSYVANSVYKLNKILSNFIELDLFFDEKLFNNFLKKHSYFLKEIEGINRESSFYNEEFEVEKDFIQSIGMKKTIYYIKNKKPLIKEIIQALEDYINNYILIEINRCFNSKKKQLHKIEIKEVEKNNIVEENIIIINAISEEFTEEDENIVFLKELYEKIIKKYFRVILAEKEFYFPASRTGFVLALDEIASGLFKRAFGANTTSTKLTEPTIDFISNFMDIKLDKFKDYKRIFEFGFNMKDIIRDKQIDKILEFIEKRLTKGKIIEDKEEDEYLNFYLQPKNSEKIELHLTSSSAVELLPLVVFLKHFSKLDDKFLIIEEPEAHLHPQAQIEMARLIVMLVNAGAKVLITTHSDYILSEINNCIKLTNIQKSKRNEYLKKYKLDESVVIDKDRVSAYLFKEKKDKVIVDKLSIDEYGIANDNFDEVLDELLDRTQEINESF